MPMDLSPAWGTLAILLGALWLLAAVYVWLANLDDMDRPFRDFFACLVAVPFMALRLAFASLAALVVAVWNRMGPKRC